MYNLQLLGKEINLTHLVPSTYVHKKINLFKKFIFPFKSNEFVKLFYCVHLYVK